ncbi:YceI family protein [Pseudoxanthomonas putridarboris]|uniref:YceI family protein n=1 Tax=Pseudoxanthomonas putridarboris TaxID=752605 RepID=A0ABU9IWM8_9GAMM
MATLVRLGALGLGLLAACPLHAGEKTDFDPDHTRLGFELRTRWGQVLDGVFTHYDGEITHLPDGRQQARLRMYTRDVEIIGHPRYSEWARSEKFFDADRYPVVVFTSRPYDETLLREGGKLEGELSIKGISRPRSLDVSPSTCDRPAKDCDVLATGAVRRSDYDMDDWLLAVSDRVVFVLRARVKDGTHP